jgi:hypothetical protein
MCGETTSALARARHNQTMKITPAIAKAATWPTPVAVVRLSLAVS